MVEAIWVVLAVLLAALAAALGVVLSARMRDVRKTQAKLAAVEERLREAEQQLQARHDGESQEVAKEQEAHTRLARERDEARAKAARLADEVAKAGAERDAERKRAETLEQRAAASARAAAAADESPRKSGNSSSNGVSSEIERLSAALGRAEHDLELSAQRAQRFEEAAARLREEVAQMKAELARVATEADERVRRQQQVGEQRLAELQKRQAPASASIEASTTAADIPAAPPSIREPKRTGKVAESPARGKIGAKASVLLVDSEERSRKALVKYLESADYTVCHTPRGEDVMTLARTEAPSAVILDTDTAGTDGWALLQELKADAATRDIPVIVVAPARERERALDLGAAQAFARPLDSAVLLGAIRSAILARKNRERRMVAAARVSAMTSSPGVPFDEVVAAAVAAREQKASPASTAAASEKVSAATP